MINSEPLISIITVNYNNTEVTSDLLSSIAISSYANYEVIIVDNGSSDNSISELKKVYPDTKIVLSEKNLGFAGGNNLGVLHAEGEYVFFVNNDTVFTEHLLSTLCSKLLLNDRLGAVSPMILFYDHPEMIQYVGSTRMNRLTVRNRHVGNKQINKGQFDLEEATDYAHGAAMMIPMKVIDKVGMMCVDYFLYYEELDWCERIRAAGYLINVVPKAKIYHKESVSAGKNSPIKTYYLTRSRFLFARRNMKGITYISALTFLSLISWPRNILKLLFKRVHLVAYCSAFFWNITNGKFNYKPFNL